MYTLWWICHEIGHMQNEHRKCSIPCLVRQHVLVTAYEFACLQRSCRQGWWVPLFVSVQYAYPFCIYALNRVCGIWMNVDNILDQHCCICVNCVRHNIRFIMCRTYVRYHYYQYLYRINYNTDYVTVILMRFMRYYRASVAYHRFYFGVDNSCCFVIVYRYNFVTDCVLYYSCACIACICYDGCYE